MSSGIVTKTSPQPYQREDEKETSRTPWWDQNESQGRLGTDNLLLLSDSYKVSHFKQYPKGTKSIYSYFESRGGRHVEVCFFGLQYVTAHRTPLARPQL